MIKAAVSQHIFNITYIFYIHILVLLMRVIHIQKYGRTPLLAHCQIPSRKPSELLVKMSYAPINPSDLNFYLGSYGIRKQNFVIMGFQGSGVIAQSEDRSLIGRKVAVLSNKSNGTYAQYISSQPEELIIIPKSHEERVSLEQLSMMSINPLSAMGLCQIISQEQPNNVILSAAASSLCKIIASYIRLRYKNINIYGFTRTEQHDEALIKLGYQHIYRMDQVSKIKAQIQQKTVFLDCVGGNFAGEMFNGLPKDSLMVNYGRLSKQNLGGIDLGQLYFSNKMIRGFWLNTYLKSINQTTTSKIKQQIIDNIQIFKQPIRKVLTLDSFTQATRQSIKNQSLGKILLSLA